MFDINYIEKELKPTKTVWVTTDGQRIKVRKLSDDHLVNVFRLLQRNNARELVTFPAICKEILKRGLFKV